MKSKKALGFFITGTMLLLAALFIVFYNLYTDQRGGAESESVLTALKAKIPEPAEPSLLPEFEEDLFARYDEEALPEETLIEIEGKYYIGYISMPTIGIELPVLSEWSEQNLKTAPCRYKGMVQTGDLILAGHNYRTHFGRIQRLNSGDLLYFTDGDGVVHTYQVIQSEIVGGYDISAMEFGSADFWDLTLFTCTLNSQSRITVRAVLVDDT